MRNRTVTAVLDADRDAVFEFMADIERLPEWATEFARELRRDGDDHKEQLNSRTSGDFTILATMASA